ncbi:MAG: PAS domain S-box protein [Anaerolineaceae bacterium]|nr:PAS domain S-box protein [Anaerolineaceae bacterium]
MENTSLKIVFVSEDPNILDSVGKIVERTFPNTIILTSTDENNSFTLIKSESPNVVLLDIKIKNPDAITLCRKLNNEATTKSIPVICLISPETDQASLQQAADAGVDAFLSCPFIEVDLRTLIRSLTKTDQQSRIPIDNQDFFYQSILQTTKDGFWLLNTQGKFIDVNDAYCRMLGYTKEELLQLSIPDFDVVEDAELAAVHIQKIIQNGSDLFTARHRKKDGSIFDVEISATFLNIDGGRLICFCRDITERKQVEKAILDNTEMFSQFIHHSPIYIYIKEVTPTSSKVLHASENFIDMIGIPGSEMAGKTMEELFPPEFAQKISADDWDVVSKDGIFQDEEILNNRTYTSIKFPIQQGEKHLLAGYTIDITKQNQAEEALRNSEEHFRSIVDNSDAGYFFIDCDGIIQDVNQAWVQLHRYDSADEILGHHFTEIQKVEDIEAAKAFVSGIMENDSRYLKGDFSRKCKDGSIGYHTFSGRPVTKNGEVIGIEGFIIDTTEHRSAIEALRMSKERYHLIDEASQDSIYSYDRQSRFTHANTNLCKTLGLKPEQIIGKTHEELGFQKALCDEWATLHQQVYDTNATVIAETTGSVPDGTIRCYEVVLNPMHDGNGEIIGIAGTTRDINERKLAEAKIKEQIEELQRWHTITMGREDRILELKREINKLLHDAGEPIKYESVGEG